MKIDFYQNRIVERYASRPPKLLSLKQLTMFSRHVKDNKLLLSANYVREELPVRLAHRIQKFQQLPFIVGSNPFIETVYNLYWEAFETFRSVPEIKNEKENDDYCDILRRMLSSHKNVIPVLVYGIQETQNHMEIGDINKFMNETFRSRIGRRTLAEQHILLTEGVKRNAKDLGIVQDNVRASDLLKTCIRECDSVFIDSFKQLPPKIKIDGNVNATLTYIPNHLEYIMFEILKNSMQHTFENHRGNAHLPSIKVTIGKSDKQFMIRVSDQGGGVPSYVIKDLWSFIKHNENLKLKDIIPGILQDSKSTPVVGMRAREEKIEKKKLYPMDVRLGIGLPMAQAYANYWGGSIKLHSMVGHGADAYVTINTINSFESMAEVDE